jgi:hypothetical protein
LELAINPPIKDINPYTLAAGRDLDQLIHRRLFGLNDEADGIPFYSVDAGASSKVRSKLRSLYGHPIIVGQARMPGRRHFARYDSDPSTATEVLAETEPLAICRLAVILMKRG